MLIKRKYIKYPCPGKTDLSYEVGDVLLQFGRLDPPVVQRDLHHGAVLLVRAVLAVQLVVTPLVLRRGGSL